MKSESGTFDDTGWYSLKFPNKEKQLSSKNNGEMFKYSLWIYYHGMWEAAALYSRAIYVRLLVPVLNCKHFQYKLRSHCFDMLQS